MISTTLTSIDTATPQEHQRMKTTRVGSLERASHGSHRDFGTVSEGCSFVNSESHGLKIDVSGGAWESIITRHKNGTFATEFAGCHLLTRA